MSDQGAGEAQGLQLQGFSLDGQAELDPAALAAMTAALHAAAAGTAGPDQGAINVDDYYAQLAAMAASGAAIPGMDLSGGGGIDGQSDYGQQGYAHDSGGDRLNKPKSAYRGVCWNKKNRRWQAAINAGGLYIYLGSFVAEVDAAKTFDKANLYLRGSRGKLNFSYENYVDSEGHLIPEGKLFSHISNMLQKGKGKRGRPGPGEAGGPDPGSVVPHVPGLEISRLPPGSGPQHLFPDPSKAMPVYPYNGGQKHAEGLVDLPAGCTATGMLPGDDDVFGVLFVSATPGMGTGAIVWDGTGCVELGYFETEKDARQAAGIALKLAIFQRHLLRNGPEIVGALQAGAAHQAILVNGQGRHSKLDDERGDPNIGAMLGMGNEAEMAAVAAAVAAATQNGGTDASGMMIMPDLAAMLAANGVTLEALQGSIVAAPVEGQGEAEGSSAAGGTYGQSNGGAGAAQMQDPAAMAAAAAAAAAAGVGPGGEMPALMGLDHSMHLGQGVLGPIAPIELGAAERERLNEIMSMLPGYGGPGPPALGTGGLVLGQGLGQLAVGQQ